MGFSDDGLKLHVKRLQKLSFRVSKLLERERFESHIRCGHVIEYRYVLEDII